jgi:hypothetical protein
MTIINKVVNCFRGLLEKLFDCTTTIIFLYLFCQVVNFKYCILNSKDFMSNGNCPLPSNFLRRNFGYAQFSLF